MAGPLSEADATVSTARLNRAIQYEPKDLTVSVEAGMLWRDLSAALAVNGQMIPLDPPLFESSTVGGVIASNTSGPRRRQYGSARDMVIGMKFVTLEGKIVQSGGMVVKNVAGLDMAKLMIGSFGTLAAIASVNFKLAPIPPASATFILEFSSVAQAIAARDQILQGVLHPVAIDLLNPAAAARVGFSGVCLCVQASGNPAVVARWRREFATPTMLEGDAETALWTGIREFTPLYLRDNGKAVVVRTSTTLSGVQDIVKDVSAPYVARAGNGVIYRYYRSAESVPPLKHGDVIEWAPDEVRRSRELWPEPGSGLAVMSKIKQLFDPNLQLNKGRLYGRI